MVLLAQVRGAEQEGRRLLKKAGAHGPPRLRSRYQSAPASSSVKATSSLRYTSSTCGEACCIDIASLINLKVAYYIIRSTKKRYPAQNENRRDQRLPNATLSTFMFSLIGLDNLRGCHVQLSAKHAVPEATAHAKAILVVRKVVLQVVLLQLPPVGWQVAMV